MGLRGLPNLDLGWLMVVSEAFGWALVKSSMAMLRAGGGEKVVEVGLAEGLK
jgi:hypothetical protein